MVGFGLELEGRVRRARGATGSVCSVRFVRPRERGRLVVCTCVCDSIEGAGMELLLGIEPKTSSLPRKCSTAELQQRLATRPRPELDTSCLEQPLAPGLRERGAGDGNRTHAFSLEG